MLERIISGGQTGADQAALRAARTAGIPTDGFAPLGWKTEDGPAPWLADFGLVECSTPGYPARTKANVYSSDATLWIGDTTSPDAKTTMKAARTRRKDCMVVCPGASIKPSDVAAWIVQGRFRTLNIAGNGESRAPGIGANVERFLGEVFARLRRDGGSSLPAPSSCA
jgi:Circularly permutated YpsA SLOG family